MRKQTLQAKGQSAKVHQTCEALREMAREVGAGGQMPTIRTLCSDLGVSLATMNSALTLLERQKVLWRRHGSGIYVAETLHQRHIGLICDPAQSFLFGVSPFWSLLVEDAYRQAEEQGLRISMHFAGDYPPRALDYPHDPSPLSEELIRNILDGSLHGVLSIGVEHSVVRWIEAQGVPVVSIAGPSLYIMSQDYPTSARMGVEELARQGCKTVGLWQPARLQETQTSQRTKQTFVKSARALGLHHKPEYDVQHAEDSHESSTAQGFNAAMHNFDPDAATENRPDGIVIMDDIMAQGVFMALDRLGLKLGRDVHAAAFSVKTSPSLLAWEDLITRMEFDPREIVDAMLNGVLRLADGKQPPWIKKARPAGPEVPEIIYSVQPQLIPPTAP